MERARDLECQKKGYLVLLQNGVSLESVHLKNHEHYHREVYKPSINSIRKTMHGCDVENVDEVPNHLTSVGWNDGDIQQLKAIVKKENGDQCLQYKNIKCKQSAKRSGVEQMCDVCIIFLLLKQL